MQETMSDNALMMQVKNGNPSFLGILFERYHRVLFQFFYNQHANRSISEDLVQTVFLRILKYAHSFRGEGEFKQWMFFIARNVSKDHYQKHRKYPKEALEAWEDRLVAAPTQATNMETQEDLSMLQQALDQLDSEKRELLIMSKLKGMRYKQIGEVLGCSEGAVKVKVFRALKALKRAYTEIEQQ